jgi:hypothetical protein
VLAQTAEDPERLIGAMARYIVARGGIGPQFPQHLIDLVLQNIEERRRERCGGCGRSVMAHLIEFFENGIDHNWS